MPLSNEKKNRIDGIEEAVNGQTPVEDLNEEREKNRNRSSENKYSHVLMGKWITAPERKKPGKNAPNEFDKKHPPKHMGYMPRYPRPSSGLKEFFKKFFGKK